MALNHERVPSESDRQTVRTLFHALPIWERGKPLVSELLRVLLVRKDAEPHLKILPDYCYHIFDALRRTYFKGFPSFDDTVRIIDPASMTKPVSVGEIHKVLHIEWRNVGRVFGVAMRCNQFFQLEAEPLLEREGFNNFSPEDEETILVIIFGKTWLETNREKINAGLWDEIFAQQLTPIFADCQAKINEQAPVLGALAARISPQAMIEFSEGFAEGLKSFLDADGQLVGESTRSGSYTFLLLLWPEIKAMLAAEPKKTLSDLHEWLLPFMRVGVMPFLDIDQLRDVCAPPPSGIGLTLRPLKKVRPAPSA